MNLSLLIILPIVTALVILFCKKDSQVRVVSFLGSVAQLALCVFLLTAYLKQRGTGGNAQMLFEYNRAWFAPLNINYHVGVDGISIAMILLTAFVVTAGVLVSWATDKWSREFFFLLMLLSAGAYGFFYFP